jgi:hypothetical protein
MTEYWHGVVKLLFTAGVLAETGRCDGGACREKENILPLVPLNLLPQLFAFLDILLQFLNIWILFS